MKAQRNYSRMISKRGRVSSHDPCCRPLAPLSCPLLPFFPLLHASSFCRTPSSPFILPLLPSSPLVRSLQPLSFPRLLSATSTFFCSPSLCILLFFSFFFSVFPQLSLQCHCPCVPVAHRATPRGDRVPCILSPSFLSSPPCPPSTGGRPLADSERAAMSEFPLSEEAQCRCPA